MRIADYLPSSVTPRSLREPSLAEEHPVAAALVSGLAGAAVLTLLHESARRVVPAAPRMDVVGRRAIAGPLRAAGVEPPKGAALQGAAMGMDVVSNSLFYALIGLASPGKAWASGSVVGALAGAMALVMPPLLGLGKKPSLRSPQTALMTFTWYFVGAITSAAVYRALSDEDDE